ncbi:prolipoprotein diacylglyceryl transferase [Arthrospiribacter ruber]|uniref:Phosphatidylglycerol--prolipoprotein diacylglyceryl transferase n=1 Tax=Arthrospiribacter ruber TaxID=2487934 RepID=A0A951IVE2_9BACT|nr:prolipoprotein diacylglyceryl transferase [Arthrospiribacter ruber]MBW3467017.1 prolipoprotein diacylglyceryl transferase [Arthrospiribacter ruber]
MISFILWDIDPFVIADFEFLRWYGISWVIGMMLGYQVLVRIFKFENRPIEELDRLTVYVIVGAVVGARLGHVLFYDPAYYLNNPIEILPIKINPAFQFTGLLGLASHGGVLGALIALYLYIGKYKEDFLWSLDRLTVAGAILGGFIRIGNLMNSEIIGIPTQVPWAFIFAHVDPLPRHPAQLYEALFYFGIFIILYLVWKSGKVRMHKGFLFGLGLTLVFTQRFFMEFIKENQVEFEENLFLNMGQILSIPLIILGLLIMLWSVKIRLRGSDKN